MSLSKKMSTLAAMVTIISGMGIILGWMVSRQNHFKMYFCDEDGFARKDLAVETPDGIRFTYNEGEIICPVSWVGEEIVIYNAKPRRWIQTQKITKERRERTVKVIVPKEVLPGAAEGELNMQQSHQ